ncbi:hypothetical protein GIW45_20975 [Pseudomonas congelans]|uniref:hypothetical protein n=1 Tax=Pseudomonas congelans TaxID=200452 RepID=UPI001F1799C4|nr:hypothetical protein [Pseudomonas congelans]MCF5166481.1 hypothetical protein [Pseudomonas congelans]
MARLQAAGAVRRRPGATDEQIKAHLHNADGSLRSHRDVANALHAAGLGVDNNRVVAQLRSTGEARNRPGATDEQINAHLHNADGSLRSHRDVANALHAAGLGVDNNRVVAQLRSTGEARNRSSATDEQINAHLHNADGSLRTYRDAASALHDAGFGADTRRILAQRQAARGQR